MNQAYENIITRTSCKAYSDQKVSKEILEKIVEAGQFAPSGMNQQSFAFVVVQDEKLIKELSKLNASIMHANIDPFYGASSLIIVFAKKDVPTHIYDGSLAMENLMLAANALGVSGCWIHRAKEVFELEQGKELLKKWNLEGYEGIGNCILGYPSKEAQTRKPRTSVVVWE